MQTPLIIAISGASGSGKSLFTQNLINAFSEQGRPVQILREDHYYRAQDHLPMEAREKNNYDHPNAFDCVFTPPLIHSRPTYWFPPTVASPPPQ